jgi:hypothetical protein
MKKLNYVPYAMSASNGVPTGSIMPYMGLLRQQAGHCMVVTPSTATVLAMVGNRAQFKWYVFLRDRK